MQLFEIIRVAINSLKSNKLRSILTILGIVVGIFSIISISTIISMLQTSIEEGVSQLGQNTFQIQKWPAVNTGGPGSFAKYRNRKDITIEDYDKVKDKLSYYGSIGAEQWGFGKRVKFGNNETNPNVPVCGGTPEAFPNNDWIIGTGRTINYNDVDSYSKVIVLGADLINPLFGFRDALGEEVKIDGEKYRVIGILEKRGEFFGQSRDNLAIIPITTFQTKYGKRANSLNITVKVEQKDGYTDVIERAEGFMRTIRKVAPGEENDFDIFSNQSVLTQINDITSGVKIGAYVIGMIALIAAGVGIMNIMLVSVTERTKEIGIRKAIGAKKSNILIQFITEAIILSQLGGLIGIFLGVSVGNLAGSFLNAIPVIPIDWVLIGVLLCVIIGVGFGTYPAYKAANLDPIEALRYE